MFIFEGGMGENKVAPIPHSYYIYIYMSRGTWGGGPPMWGIEIYLSRDILKLFC